jgi:predicted AlkP superfamily phosphohydrolase/phosphomutase
VRPGRPRRQRSAPLLALTALLAAGLVSLAHAVPGPAGGVFIVGVDGMDPVIVERMMKEGKLPNFSKLAAEGTFQSLATVNPPQSPVAWSSFVTGMDPGGHGIFDFIHRDPATYLPISSATPPPEDPGGALHLFGYVIPLSVPELVNNRGGTPWWDALTDHGVDVEVFRIPGNFPTPPSEAKVLDGMGTVDLRGGFGTYTVYTDFAIDDEDPKGDIEYVAVQDLNLDGHPDTATAVLRGPPNQMQMEPGALPTDADYLAKGVTFHLSKARDAVVIEIGGQRSLLRPGEWSDWMEVTFDALPMGLMPVPGTVRFYALELGRGFRIYASPVNISPSSPVMPITSPDEFADELFAAEGFFYTQGLPEETDALKDGVFDDDDYIKQVRLIQEDTRRLVDLALERFEPGDATFVYLSDIDLQSHMLWRHGDPKYPDAPKHPAYDRFAAQKHANAIEGFYRDVDQELGSIRERLPAETLLIVMSDHGFQPFTREVHLNAWLRDHGYLTLKDGKTEGQIALGDVDWSKTRAYGLGFNGLYLNRVGRESEGIVEEAEADTLMSELASKLEAWRDPGDGSQAILRVERGAEIYSPARSAEGPDLLVGYNVGYGCSDESTLGEITAELIKDNTSHWSGNHLMAPEVVPGVLLVNRKLAADGHGLVDLTATILSYYGVAPLPGMTGKPIL